MQSTVSLTTQIDIGLTEDKKRDLVSKVKKGEIAQLSSDKESGPFMLFLMGDTLETVANKTSYPLDIIYLTAIYYNWPNKVKAIAEMAENSSEKDPMTHKVQKDLINSILIATYIAMQKELGDVISGRLEARKCRLIPNNIHSLEKLINMASTLSNPAQQATVNQGTIIQGQNIQVIQEEKKKPKPETNQAMLDLLES
jgi:hypothetical protein